MALACTLHCIADSLCKLLGMNTIIKVTTLPNSCYTVLYWSRTLSLSLYYILLVACTEVTTAVLINVSGL